MDKPHLFFLYCPKFVLFSEDWQNVFLARRYGEADYDGMFSFIGGKLETSDESIAAGMKREKDEEIGSEVKVKLCLTVSNNVLFRKQDGSTVILPHYVAQYVSGNVQLNPEEYSEYKWVPLAELASLEPKIENIPEQVAWALKVRAILKPEDFIEV